MELATQAEIYTATMNNDGNYIDKIQSSIIWRNGIRCACGSRKDKSFTTASSFAIHIKSKTHIKWLAELNCNKINHYAENVKLNELVRDQRLIIAKMDKANTAKDVSIMCLTQQLQRYMIPNIPIEDLLGID